MPWSLDDIPKYVINLDRRNDRWMTFQASSGFVNLTNLRRWSGTDGKLINLEQDNRISLFTKYNIIRSVRRSHMELNTKGGVGCYISHAEVWKNFLEKSENEVGMILEDDALMDEASVQKIKLFIKSSDILQNTELWDFCILAPHAGNVKHGAMYPNDITCMRLMEFTGLTGYLFTKRGIRKILPHIYPIQGHVDWFISICAQLQLIDVCTPPKSLIRIRYSATDIQKYNTCEICDIKTDFKKDSAIIPLWRLRTYQFEEIVLVLGLIFIGATYAKRV
jgi:GR25 family glycosyltransferase involved in LPS biosynthesis